MEPVSKREARYLRRKVDQKIREMPPMKLEPSKKGIATVFLFTAALGYATGALAHWVLH